MSAMPVRGQTALSQGYIKFILILPGPCRQVALECNHGFSLPSLSGWFP